jgi:hypothetical protein
MRKIAFMLLALALMSGAAFAQSAVQPYVVNGTDSNGVSTTCPVGSVAGIACPMPVTVTGGTGSTVTANQGTKNSGGAAGWWAQIEAGAVALTSTLVGSSQALDSNVVQSALPTGASTSANQSVGTSGTPSSVVETVQGAPSMTPVSISINGATDGVVCTGSVTSATQISFSGAAACPSSTAISTVGYTYMEVVFTSVGSGNQFQVREASDGTNYVAMPAAAINTAGNPANITYPLTVNVPYCTPIIGTSAQINISTYSSGTVTAYVTLKNVGSCSAFNQTGVVVGITQSGNADSGAPVKTGGVYTTGPSAVTTGQRVNTWADQFGDNGLSPQCGGCVPETASATGTTGATTATLAAASGKTTFICGFSIRANATAAGTGNATVTGTITGTLNFTQWSAPLATGLGITEENFSARCIPASGTNQPIAVVSAAPGTGGTVSVTAWGFQQ